ncbi:MAG: pilus assembly protein PilC [Burkholderiales bacterium]|nr:pilus assembly protein PilC [Burkholderiales bacterium]
MARKTSPRFRKSLLALAAGATFAPCGAWALDLAESPPGTVEPYVRPNVIISIDDSGSMKWVVDQQWVDGDSAYTEPDAFGVWHPKAQRISILRYALISIFDPLHPKYDPSLMPDKKLRLAWQVMWNNGGASDAKNVNSTTMKTNSMRVLQGSHRTNFLNFVNSLSPRSGTPSHWMFSQADAYMRQPLGTNSAWANDPGTTGSPYLACRRSYHIFMSDGRWNSVSSGGAQDNATNLTLPDGMVYGGTTAPDRAKSALYRDTVNDTLSDWAFRSWAVPMQTSGMTGTLQPAADYRAAPATENFGNDSNGTPAILERYWNPRYDPATWPHMVTYTIGFSTDATTWPGAPTIIAPPVAERVPFSYKGSFPDLVTGNRTWPDMGIGEDVRALDLWHSALNGRGRFYAVMKGEDLEKAFREILGQINTATDPDLSSSATSGANVSRSEVGKYTAAYQPENFWKGYVTADKVKRDGTTYPDPGWGGKNTADKLDALPSVSSRLVLSWSDKWDSTNYKGGVPFKWASDESNLSSPQKVWLQKNMAGTDEGATKGQQRLNYIRGERGMEGVDPSGYTPSNPFRQRKSIQGDIINSDVWYTGAPAADYLLKGYTAFVRSNKSRPGMLYVGGNDGMLHGFAAADGQEKLAYVPRGVIPTLTLLTDPQYNNKHKYFVDGSPMTGDVDMNGGIQDPTDPNYGTYSPDWRTMLVGTLGLGGKGYFVLDVSNPTATTTVSGLLGFAEGNAQQLVKQDRTRGPSEPAPNCAAMTGAEKTTCLQVVDEDKDIGFIAARPVRDDNDAMRTTQITRMNNNRWAVVLGNGYNSANQRPVLLVQYLDGAKELLRLPVTTDAPGTGNAKDNGLGSPRVVDINGDGMADVVYAGDNLGNLWKFDLTNASAANWKVAFNGNPLFTTRGPAALGSPSRSKIQPIATAPTVRANDRTKTIGSGPSAKTVRVGGMMVAFGTGRNVTKDDPSNIDVQTIYSVLDNTRYREVSSALGKRLEVHPGGGTCPGGADCVPAPATLGTGVTSAKLAQQKFTEISGGDFATVDIVDELKKETWDNFNGWYLDLPSVGERLLKPMDFYDASNLLTVWSQVPAKGSNVDPDVESCDSTSVDGERQYRTFVNIMDGKRPSVQIVDKNNDNKYDSADAGVSRRKVAKGPHSIIKKDKYENRDIDAKNNGENTAALPEESLRPSWRQIQ